MCVCVRVCVCMSVIMIINKINKLTDLPMFCTSFRFTLNFQKCEILLSKVKNTMFVKIPSFEFDVCVFITTVTVPKFDHVQFTTAVYYSH